MTREEYDKLTERQKLLYLREQARDANNTSMVAALDKQIQALPATVGNPESPPGRLEAAGHGLLSGATFGGADEYSGMVNRLLSAIGLGLPKPGVELTPGAAARAGAAYTPPPTAYEVGRDYWSEPLAAAREAHPWTAGLSEAAGAIPASVVLGGPIWQSMRGASMPAKAAVTGGTEGLLYGGLSAEPGNRAAGAGIGAGAGAVTGPIVGWILDHGGKLSGGGLAALYRKVVDTDQAIARRVVQQALVDDGLSPELAAEALDRWGPDAILADLGENLRGQLRAAAAKPGVTKQHAKEVLEPRLKGEYSRLMMPVSRDIAQGDTYPEVVARMEQKQRMNGKPLYDLLEGLPLDKQLDRPTVSSFVADKDAGVPGRPTVNKAAKKAVDNWLDTGEPLPPEMMNFNIADDIKKILDDKINVAYRKGAKNEFRRLTKLKNEFLASIDESVELDTGVDLYRIARERWGGPESVKEAAETGLDIFKMKPLLLDEYVKSLEPSRAQAFRTGAAQAMQELLEKVNDTGIAAKKLMRNPDLRNRLRTLFDNDEDFEAFLKIAEREGEFGRTTNVVLHGSPTARIQEESTAIQNLIDGVNPLHYIQDPTTAAVGGGLKALFGNRSASPEVLEEIGNILLKQGMSREEVTRLLTPTALQQLGIGDAWAEAARHMAGIYGPMAAHEYSSQ